MGLFDWLFGKRKDPAQPPADTATAAQEPSVQEGTEPAEVWAWFEEDGWHCIRKTLRLIGTSLTNIDGTERSKSASKLRIGDKVKILQPTPTIERGWLDSVIASVYSDIGCIGDISSSSLSYHSILFDKKFHIEAIVTDIENGHSSQKIQIGIRYKELINKKIGPIYAEFTPIQNNDYETINPTVDLKNIKRYSIVSLVVCSGHVFVRSKRKGFFGRLTYTNESIEIKRNLEAGRSYIAKVSRNDTKREIYITFDA